MTGLFLLVLVVTYVCWWSDHLEQNVKLEGLQRLNEDLKREIQHLHDEVDDATHLNHNWELE
jgi:hypothetical protein